MGGIAPFSAQHGGGERLEPSSGTLRPGGVVAEQRGSGHPGGMTCHARGAIDLAAGARRGAGACSRGGRCDLRERLRLPGGITGT